MNIQKNAKMKMYVLIFSLSFPISSSVNGGIPVIDIPGLVQSILTAIETVSQTLRQVQQYRTQLTQYENQLRNTINPDVFIWSEARETMSNLRASIDTLQRYRNNLGSLDNYLNRFRDLSFYKNNDCFTSVGCSDSERNVIINNRELASESLKQANDAAFRSIDLHQNSLENDARRLESLQNAAQGAEGQVQAIQYSNQLASSQINQLLQIRGLLISQHNSATTLMQSKTEIDAQEGAASQQLRNPSFTPSPSQNW